MTEFKVPELGENVTTGDVLRVLVNVGDTIEKDQPVVELETDKATVEVPSSVGGVVKDIRVKQGDKVKVGDTILSVEESGAGAEKPAASEPRSSEAAPPAAATPAVAEQSDEAPPAPRPERPPAPKPDQKVVSMPRPGRPEPVPARAADTPKPSPAASRPERGPAAPAAPGVRRLAREIGVDVNEVQGTGPGGRITEEDVKEHARRIIAGAGETRGAVERRGAPLPDFEKWGAVERQAMSNIRRTTAQRLSHAWSTIPHVTQFDTADITSLEELRKKYAPVVEKAGGKLTVTSILVKVLGAAVKQFPQFNASVDTEKAEIVFKKYVNVGVAVDTDRGLLVPVIRDVDQKNITQIAIEVQKAAEKARARKLTLEEMDGGGITISNLGGIGGTAFTPIVNWPEAAILGVSRGSLEPVYRDGAFVPRLLLPLSLSYDHRLIDGADAIRFLRWVAEALEQPFLLSLHG